MNKPTVENATLKGNKELYSKTLDSRVQKLHDAWFEVMSTFEQDNWDTEDRKELTDIMDRLTALTDKQKQAQKHL